MFKSRGERLGKKAEFKEGGREIISRTKNQNTTNAIPKRIYLANLSKSDNWKVLKIRGEWGDFRSRQKRHTSQMPSKKLIYAASFIHVEQWENVKFEIS